MSTGTDQLATAMAKHSANKDACQTANQAKDVAYTNFGASAVEVANAIALVQSEADDLAKAKDAAAVPGA